MDLSRFPRRRYTEGATPLEFLPNFTRALGGPNVWIKRDDLLGLSPGGNKTRKLEFLVADALAQGADTLVTCGAPQSNHCRITLSAAVREGLKCRFVIEERVPGSYGERASGNHFLFRLMGVVGEHRARRRARGVLDAQFVLRDDHGIAVRHRRGITRAEFGTVEQDRVAVAQAGEHEPRARRRDAGLLARDVPTRVRQHERALGRPSDRAARGAESRLDRRDDRPPQLADHSDVQHRSIR